ncbi:MAG: FkbM family methyltransferase [Candidatus Parvarchaeota archaeon]
MPSFKIGKLIIEYNHTHDIAAIIEVFVLNVYKNEKIRKGDVVLDLGAGIGEFSLLASKKVGSNGKVIAIEPSPDDYRTLTNNLRENHCDNVFPLNLAVSDFDGEIELEFKGKKFKARCKSLKDILNEVGFDKINFVKMDIEGAEKEVIPQNTDIFRSVDYLSMEIHNGYQGELIRIMDGLGFRFERITKKGYIQNAIRFTLRHPIKSYALLHLLKQYGEYPGLKKIANGIEIESSDYLVVGTFIKRGSSHRLGLN